jgi:predicted Zn finger-like uncharacterized protein
MYTRCPECQTAFRVTVAQLKARDGLVRCGRCSAIFRADLRLFSPPRDTNSKETAATEEIALDSASEKAATTVPPATTATDEPEIPTVSELTLFLKPERRIHPAVWAVGIVVSTVLLLGQFAYFYRNELAVVPQLRDPLIIYCQWIDCEVAAPPNVVPDLVETTIAPHPRYANVLRVRAALVNRSTRPQPLPLLQLSLTTSDGDVLARRTFAPREYIDRPVIAKQPMEPNVVVNALIDVTNPDGRAAGYEIKLLPPTDTPKSD